MQGQGCNDGQTVRLVRQAAESVGAVERRVAPRLRQPRDQGSTRGPV
jgi:hypothetical protein